MKRNALEFKYWKEPQLVEHNWGLSISNPGVLGNMCLWDHTGACSCHIWAGQYSPYCQKGTGLAQVGLQVCLISLGLFSAGLQFTLITETLSGGEQENRAEWLESKRCWLVSWRKHLGTFGHCLSPTISFFTLRVILKSRFLLWDLTIISQRGGESAREVVDRRLIWTSLVLKKKAQSWEASVL